MATNEPAGTIEEAEAVSINDNTITFKHTENAGNSILSRILPSRFSIPFLDTPRIKLGKRYKIKVIELDGENQ